jgi:hypothetical protein
MRNNDFPRKLRRGSSPSVPEGSQEPEDWGVDWMPSSRQRRDDESNGEKNEHGGDQEPQEETPVVSTARIKM